MLGLFKIGLEFILALGLFIGGLEFAVKFPSAAAKIHAAIAAIL